MESPVKIKASEDKPETSENKPDMSVKKNSVMDDKFLRKWAGAVEKRWFNLKGLTMDDICV